MKTDLAPVCRSCSRPLNVPATGRPPQYCGTECRRIAEFSVRRVQRRLQSLEDDLSDARLDEKLAINASYRKPHRQRQVALA